MFDVGEEGAGVLGDQSSCYSRVILQGSTLKVQVDTGPASKCGSPWIEYLLVQLGSRGSIIWAVVCTHPCKSLEIARKWQNDNHTPPLLLALLSRRI